MPATHALAAGEIEVSGDGATWGSALEEPLFTGVSLVPRGSASERFSIRNASGDDAFLRIVLQDVSYSSDTLGDALTVALGVSGSDRVTVPLDSAQPCRVLHEGEVGAGQTRNAEVTLALGDLAGTSGQGESAQFSIGIQLSYVSLGELPPTSCGEPTTVIEITPFDSRVATIASVGVEPNTARLLEEYLLLILIAALAVGIGVERGAVAWSDRRRRLWEDEQNCLEDLA